ncbi:sigma-54-dependent transcriptional regulator [Spirochaeta dissipatitropha]
MMETQLTETDEPAIVLIVEDDPVSSELYTLQIEANLNARCVICDDSRQVVPVLVQHQVDLIVLDLHMPHVSGQEVLAQVSLQFPDIPVLVATSEDSVQVAVECMRRGAFDFITKPVSEPRLVTAVQHGLNFQALRREIQALSSSMQAYEIKQPEAFRDIITVSHRMRQLFAYIEAIAASPKPVLVLGESGTGKELIAQVLHNISECPGEFVPCNVSGLDETMFSDTLFGHMKGAFTGAASSRRGLVEHAAGGTLFLDEIGDLPMGAQVKLLRLLQEAEYYPLGSDVPRKAHLRVVAATNANLTEKMETGSFRKDLYYRLMAHTVRVPALKDRMEDVPHLVEFFVGSASNELKRSRPQVPQEIYAILENYDFPGNIRELQSLVYDAVSRSNGPQLSIEPIRGYITGNNEAPGKTGIMSGVSLSYTGRFPKLSEVEDYFIQEAIRLSDGNQSAAARMLGIAQSTLSRRLGMQNA